MRKYKQTTKEDLNIPESLDRWYLTRGWFEDYWKELPLNWHIWPDKELKQYPITNEIVQWKKHNKLQ